MTSSNTTNASNFEVSNYLIEGFVNDREYDPGSEWGDKEDDVDFCKYAFACFNDKVIK